jgi:competence protein ComEC
MSQKYWTITCFAYLTGLFSTFLLTENSAWWQWLNLIGGLSFLSILSALFIPQWWRRGPNRGFWLMMGLVALMAAIYFQWRLPQPSQTDVSRILSSSQITSKAVTIKGELTSGGKTNAKGRTQFWLAVESAQISQKSAFQPMKGTVYLTLPASVGSGLNACQRVIVSGTLYLPKTASNPGAMDFRNYLASQGVFAGLRGKKAKVVGSGFCLLSQSRSRLVTVQSAWLPKDDQGESIEGLLLSSIVLGAKAVNLPYETRTLFNQVGLAHILAASGYQVSLLVGTVLLLGKSLSPRSRFGLGLLTLLLYLGLTGFQPSVTRAGVMWLAILASVFGDRRVKPLGSLLIAVTALLLIMPIWIWDLGFQLSVLATLGIIITAPYLEKKFDFLPPKIANIIAIPLAASLWTLPLLLSQFSLLFLQAIPLNILVTPLVEIISLGGMISAIAGLMVPPVGSAIAFLLSYPIYWLIETANFFSQFSSFAPGKMPIGVLLLIYLGMILIWLFPWWQRRSLMVGIAMISLIFLPLIYQHFTLSKVTIFDTNKQPALVIQNQTQVTLIHHGDRETSQFTLSPFFAQEAINQVECELNLSVAQKTIKEEKTLTFMPKIKQKFHLDSPELCPKIQKLNENLPILQLNLADQNWWLVTDIKTPISENNLLKNQSPDVLIWSGKSLDPTWLDTFKPKTAIAVSRFVDQKTRDLLEKEGIRLYVTGIEGAIQWTPKKGFDTNLFAENLL